MLMEGLMEDKHSRQFKYLVLLL